MDLSESGATGLSQHKQDAADSGAPVLTLLGLAISMGASTLVAPTGAEAASSPTAKIQSATITHIVCEGETLWSLANRYSVTPKSIALANGIDDDSLQVGQRLDIINAAPDIEVRVQTTVPVAAPTAEPVANRPDVAPRNLAQLQVEQAVPPSTVVVPTAAQSGGRRSEANLLASPQSAKTIVPGAELKLVPANGNDGAERKPKSLSLSPGGGPVAQIPSQPESPVAPGAVASADEQPAEYSVATSSLSLQRDGAPVETATYRIRVGDTVSSIARAHGISSAELISMNGIRNPNRVFAGQVLTVPVSDSQPTVAGIIETPAQPVRVAAAAPTSLPELADSFELADNSEVQVPQAVTPTVEPSVSPLESEAVGDSEDAVNVAGEEATGEVVGDAGDADEIASAPAARPAPALAEEVLSEAIEPAEPASQNTYAQALRDDIAVMAQADDAITAPEAQPTAAASETTLALASDVVDEVVDPSAMNPEFEADSDVAVAATDNADPVSDVVVARAPVGSTNYQDLAEPVTGRMVSPELPPLSDDPSDHLPSATSPMDGYLWPARGLLTSGYGWRWGRMHRGIDVAAPVGTPIVAAAPGVVEFSGWNSGGYGNMVDIRHPDGNKTRYAHNSRNLVRVGQKVQQGQQIAEMGSTGYSTGPHVHFEIHVPRQGAINPVALLSER